MVSMRKNSIQNKLTQIYFQQNFFCKLFYVWDTASVFKRLQLKFFCFVKNLVPVIQELLGAM